MRLEPALLPVTGEILPAGSNTTDGARSDVSALGFWNPLSRAFFDIRVFNPMAQTNWQKDVPEIFFFRNFESFFWRLGANLKLVYSAG